jgi:hypothetical protein
MRRLLVVSGLLLGTTMLVMGCGGSGSGGKTAPPPNAADLKKMDTGAPGGPPGPMVPMPKK